MKTHLFLHWPDLQNLNKIRLMNLFQKLYFGEDKY